MTRWYAEGAFLIGSAIFTLVAVQFAVVGLGEWRSIVAIVVSGAIGLYAGRALYFWWSVRP